MFTGIVTDMGEVIAIEQRGDTRLTIATAYDPDTIAIGASIACSGCCLTAVETGRLQDGRGFFAVDASAETLARTTLGNWKLGTRINLERPLKMGDELGGHVVSGHVDDVGEIVSIAPEGDSLRFRFRVSAEIARFIAPKGSVSLDGTSLTVNEVDGDEFGVNIIPHTQAVTTWGKAQAGDRVNVEIDMLARYVARLSETRL
ncbi:riboflavin synthase [Nordella sp. HKS 07]|uniref:riboflavin synthase n=1 Tax=Nordella sp. HKS 07 TaxID=2712222 RepID=UPI0013E10F4A|nr:riboflavin synthase [Nordella sp. HKS 07]QIG50894.1 riboflavin synthase [Nordella sp. HKS 07]